MARCDGHPIVWPEATHAAEPKKGQQPYRTAAECIDWSDLGPSIWARTRPLVKTTNVRIATGIEKFVLNGRPFIVPVTHQGAVRLHSIDEPMRTVTGANRGELMLGSPLLTPFISEHANATGVFPAELAALVGSVRKVGNSGSLAHRGLKRLLRHCRGVIHADLIHGHPAGMHQALQDCLFHLVVVHIGI